MTRKRADKGLLGPLKSDSEPVSPLTEVAARAGAMLARTRDMARELEASGALMPFPSADELTADHPFSRIFGHDRARRLLDPSLAPHRVLAARRRAIVKELSLAGKPVREIAAAAGLTYYSTVKVRGQLRKDGELPGLS